MPRNPRQIVDAATRKVARKVAAHDDAKIEKARVELLATGGQVAEAARRVGVPRTTVSGWIRDGKFNKDEWDHARDQRKLEAIEHAWDGLLVQLKAAQSVPHSVFCSKDGDLVIGPEDPRAAAQIVDMLGKTLERLAGTGVTPGGGEGGGDGANPGESVYRIIVERREGAPAQPVPQTVGVRQLP